MNMVAFPGFKVSTTQTRDGLPLVLKLLRVVSGTMCCAAAVIMSKPVPLIHYCTAATAKLELSPLL